MIEQDNSIITRAIRGIEASHDIDAQMVMIAIGALERQDAKIIHIRNGDEFATCPNCGHDLMYHREGFCEWCGQKYEMLNEGGRKMTNREWIDLLSKEFSVSRASARDMFYAIFKRAFDPLPNKKEWTGGRVMEELKPCPFCGGDAEMEIKYGDYGYNPDIYSVKCKRCNAKIGKVSNNYADLSDDVVNAWNRRANDDPEMLHDMRLC